ncbi:MAG: nucleotidyltransferase domain-containing protein [Gammaproteobacteria bacterium]|nr:nucleotidyltransferase domain-containing protein [Gammaproteobacteria bacterium]
MKRDSVLAILREFKRDYGEKYGILEIGIFGSVARDEAGEKSDVDVCVKTKTPDPFVLVHVKEDIEARVHAHVDIVRVREKMNPFLKARIEKEGIYV